MGIIIAGRPNPDLVGRTAADTLLASRGSPVRRAATKGSVNLLGGKELERAAAAENFVVEKKPIGGRYLEAPCSIPRFLLRW